MRKENMFEKKHIPAHLQVRKRRKSAEELRDLRQGNTEDALKNEKAEVAKETAEQAHDDTLYLTRSSTGLQREARSRRASASSQGELRHSRRGSSAREESHAKGTDEDERDLRIPKSAVTETDSDAHDVLDVTENGGQIHISGKAHINSIVINKDKASPAGGNPPTVLPVSSTLKPVSPTSPVKTEEPTKPKTRWQKFQACYEKSPFCPSKTQALELTSILLDALAVLFYALAMVAPWIISTGPCTNCPPAFSSDTFLASSGLIVNYGVFTAGYLSNSEYIPVSDYISVLNHTQNASWTNQFAQYYFPPQATLYWSDLNSDQVCQALQPAYLLWGSPYGMCPYSTPGPIMGAQAFLILACIFAGFSMMSMIAGRKGRVGFAQFSTLCSTMSLGFGLGGVLWFNYWDYNRQHLGAGGTTVPIRAIIHTGTASRSSVVPIASTFAWTHGYVLAILAIIFEAITTLISWIAGTAQCWFSPDIDVVYGPDSWIYGTDEFPSGVNRPTLRQMSEAREMTII